MNVKRAISYTGRLMVNNAVIDYPDRKVTNGVVHVIDQVTVPKETSHQKNDKGTMRLAQIHA